MESLTPRQAELLAYIKAQVEGSGVAPSYAEMQDYLKLSSTSGVHRLVWALVDRGHLSVKPGTRRRLKVLS